MAGRLAENIFLALPALRDAGATAYGLRLDRERYGAHYRRTLERIAERDTWTGGRMEEYQAHRLREIVERAYRHVPYYQSLFRRLGPTPADFASAADLQKLPVLEKEALRAAPEQFLDERLDPSRLIMETTSGTTGIPTRIFLTPQARQEHYAFFEARCRRVAGLRYGEDPFVTFGVKRVVPVERTRPPFWCYNYAAQQLYMSVFHLAERHLASYCGELRRRPYRAMVGYGSAMATLARYMLDHGICDLRIPLAITSGEMLLPAQREAIERAFACRVFDQYGCTELAFFASEGRCGRMHLSPDYGVFEIVDERGNALPPGRTGSVLGTSLINDAQILLRLRVGDMASLDAVPCACGSPLPVIGAVAGRRMNCIVLPDGHLLHRIGKVAAGVPAVKQYQIVQEAIGVFTVYVVAGPEFGGAEAAEVARNVSASVGRAEIRVEVVDRIQRGPGGKCATVVSRVAAPAVPRASQETEPAPDITVVVESRRGAKSFVCARRATVAEVLGAVARDFGMAHGDRLLLVPAASPGTALLAERTLDSYGIGDGTLLVLTAVGGAASPAGYRPGAPGGPTDDTPIPGEAE